MDKNTQTKMAVCFFVWAIEITQQKVPTAEHGE
jgi:hypothetical protein